MAIFLAALGVLMAGGAVALAAWGLCARCGGVFMRPLLREVTHVEGELSAMLIVVPRRHLGMVLGTSMIICMGTTFIIFSGWFLIIGTPIALIAGFRMPRLIVHIVRAHTRRKLADQMVDVLSLFSNALSAGMSLVQAVELASEELSNPMGRELSAVVSSVKLGRSVEDALVDWEKRWELEDLAILASQVAVLKKTGGNLVETFATLARTIRERKKVEGRIRVLTSQGLIQGVTLIAMPFLLGLALYAVSPDYVEPLFVTEPGKKMLMVGLAMQMIGGWWIVKTVCINV